MMFRLPNGYRDAIRTVVEIRFDWRDRIKVLLGGVVVVETTTLCENKPGRVESSTRLSIWHVPALRAGPQESEIAFVEQV